MTRLVALLAAALLLTGCTASHDNWRSITQGVKQSYEAKP